MRSRFAASKGTEPPVGIKEYTRPVEDGGDRVAYTPKPLIIKMPVIVSAAVVGVLSPPFPTGLILFSLFPEAALALLACLRLFVLSPYRAFLIPLADARHQLDKLQFIEQDFILSFQPARGRGASSPTASTPTRAAACMIAAGDCMIVSHDSSLALSCFAPINLTRGGAVGAPPRVVYTRTVC